uniref:Ciliogenesis and planar polarity effector 2 n=1 Tax=Eptatretus burgeri TaxID=7764 RepID=A0A8C4N7K5_EPTBU
MRRKERGEPQLFGLLERPMRSPQQAMDTVSYKIFLMGRSGVGKSATVAKLAGLNEPAVHHGTPGIQTTTVYWPFQPAGSERSLMFRFQLWDCGETAMKKFDHILPACQEKADAVVFVFAFTNRSSFMDLPQDMAHILDPSKNLLCLAVGTKYDNSLQNDVSEAEVCKFERTSHVPVFRVGSSSGAENGVVPSSIAAMLNGLAECLWHQDQLAAGVIASCLPPLFAKMTNST